MSDRSERLELLTAHKNHALVRAAREEIAHLRLEYEQNLGSHLMASTEEVSQREIDFKRGYFRGMLWGYTALLETAGPRLQKLLERELNERE